MNNEHRMKCFKEATLEELWTCLGPSFEDYVANEESKIISNILKKLADINQRWFLSKITIVMKGNEQVLTFASSVRLKVHGMYSDSK